MVAAEAAVQLGAISMVKRDGTHSRFPLDKRRYVLGPGELCDVRINVQQTGASREQAQIEIDENYQVISFLSFEYRLIFLDRTVAS